MLKFFVLLKLFDAFEYATFHELQKSIKSNKVTFVNFGTPWCAQCLALRETWEEFVTDQEENGKVILLAVNCDELQSELNIFFLVFITV